MVGKAVVIRVVFMVAVSVPVSLGGQAPPRVDHALVFDAARKVTLMYGGGGPGDAASLGTTWSFDGATWKLVATTGPGPRADVRLAYDAAREVVLLYGGRARDASGMRTFTDTWEWNGSSWRMVSPAGPQARTHAAMGYDPVSRKVLLYGGGGAADESYNDTWSWNGTVWERLPGAGPPGRYVNGMATTDAGVILSLVYNAPAAQRDGNMGLELLSRGATGWIPIPAVPVRFSPMMPMARTANAGELLLFAGWDAPDGAPASTWLLSARGAARGGAASPGRRKGAAMAYDAARGRVVLFGGETATDVFSDTWEWYAGDWHRVP